jgi:hypothetical protein
VCVRVCLRQVSCVTYNPYDLCFSESLRSRLTRLTRVLCAAWAWHVALCVIRTARKRNFRG